MNNVIIRKPVVFYKTDEKPVVVVGHGVWLYPFNHPSPLVSNRRIAYTSPVITSLYNGVFETHNSIYKPQEMM